MNCHADADYRDFDLVLANFSYDHDAQGSHIGTGQYCDESKSLNTKAIGCGCSLVLGFVMRVVNCLK